MDTVVQRMNEWIPEATVTQCWATQSSWSPNAQLMLDLYAMDHASMGEVRLWDWLVSLGPLGIDVLGK